RGFLGQLGLDRAEVVGDGAQRGGGGERRRLHDRCLQLGGARGGDVEVVLRLQVDLVLARQAVVLADERAQLTGHRQHQVGLRERRGGVVRRGGRFRCGRRGTGWPSRRRGGRQHRHGDRGGGS